MISRRIEFVEPRVVIPKPLEKFIDDLKDSDEEVRDYAVHVLGSTGSWEVNPLLIDVFKSDSSETVRLSVANVLYRRRVMEPLMDALKRDSSSEVRYYIANCMQWVGRKDHLMPLIEVLEKEKDERVKVVLRNSIFQILQKLGVTPYRPSTPLLDYAL